VKPRVWVVGLGPGGPDLVTAGTLALVERVAVRLLRTERHPSASIVGAATTFDGVYEAAARVEDVYPAIVDAIVAEAALHGEVLYAVPGSPRVAERSVDLLVADGRVDVVVEPALSFLDLAWVRLGVDPLAVSPRLVDGRRFAEEAAGERGPLLVAQCDSRELLSDIKLAVEGEPPATVTLLHHLGLADEQVRRVAWADLDRTLDADHLTSLWIPSLAEPVGGDLVRLWEIGRRLRNECPWDAEQTHASLRRHLLEEAYEALEAIDGVVERPDAPSSYAHLEEELGDVLFQVVFHAVLAEEAGEFTLADVARTLNEKLVRRHPHVFGDVAVAGADEVVANWDAIKQAEKARTSVTQGIPGTFPADLYAAELVKQAAKVGLVAPPELDAARAAAEDAAAHLRSAAERFRAAIVAHEAGGGPA
jgi:tetrapyrrole methylase family protein/MazG family protein